MKKFFFQKLNPVRNILANPSNHERSVDVIDYSRRTIIESTYVYVNNIFNVNFNIIL